MNAITQITLHDRQPVNIRPVSARGLLTMSGDRRFTHASATANYLYITRQAGSDARGPLDYRHRDDLVATGLELPRNHSAAVREPGRIWRELDEAMTTEAPDAVRCWHVVVTLPDSEEQDSWIDRVRRYAQAIMRRGPAVEWAIHAKPDGRGGWEIPPHCHLLLTTRGFKRTTMHGKTIPNWCGPAMRAALHGEWLAGLPAAMRNAATAPFRYGAYVPAHPDCSALEGMFGRPG